MKTIRTLKGIAVVIGSAIFGLTLSGVVNADVEPVVAEVEFVNPVQITENESLRFGLIDEAFANAETITIAPNDAVTDASGRVAGGTQGAADFTITATASRTLSIQVGNISSNTGYTLGSFVCKYNGGADTACQAAPHTPTSVASAILLIGATITGDGNAVPGTFNGSFDVTVVYQ